jgi:hypothetical protein
LFITCILKLLTVNILPIDANNVKKIFQDATCASKLYLTLVDFLIETLICKQLYDFEMQAIYDMGYLFKQ